MLEVSVLGSVQIGTSTMCLKDVPRNVSLDGRWCVCRIRLSAHLIQNFVFARSELGDPSAFVLLKREASCLFLPTGLTAPTFVAR